MDAAIANIDFSPELIFANLVRLLLAYGIAFPIGWDREAGSRSAGLRTFPLVACGSCAYMLIALDAIPGAEPNARIMYGLITGIGFIGGGAILKDRGSVTGTATAASIWNTGAIGVAVALHRIEVAIALSLINFLTLRYVKRLKSRVDKVDDEQD